MINAEKALRNGLTLDELDGIAEMACPDCLSEEVPYIHSGYLIGVRQTHDDLCPRWTAAARTPFGSEYDLDRLYMDGGEYKTGEDIIKARMADPYLFLRQAVAR